MKKCLTLILTILILNFSFVLSSDWTPNGDINLRNVYNITNIKGMGGFNITGNINMQNRNISSADHIDANYLSGDGNSITNLNITNVNYSQINHNNVQGIQGGNASEYYHVNQSVYNRIMSYVFSWITNSVSDLTNYYLKNDTYNKSEIDSNLSLRLLNTDQRYNETDLISSVNTSLISRYDSFNYNMSDGSYNATYDAKQAGIWQNNSGVATYYGNINITGNLTIGRGSIWYNNTDAKYYYYNETGWSVIGSGSGGNLSFNQTLTDSLYSGIQWNYNQSDGSYNATYAGYDNTYNATYNRWSYNQTAPANEYTISTNNSLATWIDSVYLKIADMFTKNQIISMISGNKSEINSNIDGNISNVRTEIVSNISLVNSNLVSNFTNLNQSITSQLNNETIYRINNDSLLQTEIDAVNTSNNVKGLGFNTTTELREVFINKTEESNLNVNSSNWWATFSNVVYGWFQKNGNNLEFNETKFNDSSTQLGLNNGFNSTSNLTYEATTQDVLANRSLWEFNHTIPSNAYTVATNNSLAGYISDTYIAQSDESNLNVNNTQFLGGLAYTAYALLSGGNSFIGQQDFDGDWTTGGVSIINGNIFAQTGYFYNLTALGVNTLTINGSLLPTEGFDNTFDIGNSTLMWRDLYVGRNVTIGENLTVGGILVNEFLYNMSDGSFNQTYAESLIWTNDSGVATYNGSSLINGNLNVTGEIYGNNSVWQTLSGVVSLITSTFNVSVTGKLIARGNGVGIDVLTNFAEGANLTTDYNDELVTLNSSATANAIFTLPSVTSANDGEIYRFLNDAEYTMTIKPNGTDAIWNSGSGYGIELPDKGTMVALRYDSGRNKWDIMQKTGGKVLIEGLVLVEPMNWIGFAGTGTNYARNMDLSLRHGGTFEGNVQTYTAEGQFKFRPGCFNFDGTGDYIYYQDSNDWDIFGTNTTADGVKTVAFWVYANSLAADPYFLTQYEDGSNGWYIRSVSNQLRMYLNSGGVGQVTMTAGTLTTSTWTHIALVIDGSDVGIYINGSQVAYDGTWNTDTLAGSLYIGQNGAGASYLNGRMQDLHISYNNPYNANPNSGSTDSFTVPAAPFVGVMN